MNNVGCPSYSEWCITVVVGWCKFEPSSSVGSPINTVGSSQHKSTANHGSCAKSSSSFHSSTGAPRIRSISESITSISSKDINGDIIPPFQLKCVFNLDRISTEGKMGRNSPIEIVVIIYVFETFYINDMSFNISRFCRSFKRETFHDDKRFCPFVKLEVNVVVLSEKKSTYFNTRVWELFLGETVLYITGYLFLLQWRGD
mmetsp:Transcript_5936/g.9096  ORF Transcript_5936/g.9096 Transcript_5936/m.9096 type:complete len:201 (+) Transcript_5936:528-1130(+)